HPATCAAAILSATRLHPRKSRRSAPILTATCLPGSPSLPASPKPPALQTPNLPAANCSPAGLLHARLCRPLRPPRTDAAATFAHPHPSARRPSGNAPQGAPESGPATTPAHAAQEKPIFLGIASANPLRSHDACPDALEVALRPAPCPRARSPAPPHRAEPVPAADDTAP